MDLSELTLDREGLAAAIACEDAAFEEALCEEAYRDKVTTVGPEVYLRRGDCRCVLDVGGDYIGARSVGQYAPLFRLPSTAVYYILNPYRPWSDTLERIDLVLSDILTVTHLTLDDLHLIGNPNLGPGTTAREFAEGRRMLTETVSPYKPLDFYCAENSIAEEAAGLIPEPVMGLDLFILYPWRE